MRLSCSEYYREHDVIVKDWFGYLRYLGCGDDDCRRQYCKEHRYLFRQCECLEKGVDDTHLNGKAHFVYEIGDPPCCKREYRSKRVAYG